VPAVIPVVTDGVCQHRRVDDNQCRSRS
jgi:hypothetical protein